MMVDSHVNAMRIAEKLYDTWRYYGLFHGIDTSDIINTLDGMIKGVLDTWEELRAEEHDAKR